MCSDNLSHASPWFHREAWLTSDRRTRCRSCRIAHLSLRSRYDDDNASLGIVLGALPSWTSCALEALKVSMMFWIFTKLLKSFNSNDDGEADWLLKYSMRLRLTSFQRSQAPAMRVFEAFNIFSNHGAVAF